MTKHPRHLLAKSYSTQKYPQIPPDYALLTQHSRDVAEACAALTRVIGPVIEEYANVQLGADDFTRAGKATGWVEDLGKANSHFQDMLAGQPQIKQLLRHEIISGLLLWQNQPLRQWIEPSLGEWFIPALWAAMGHHLRFDRDTRADSNCPSLTVFLAHKDFKSILGELGSDLALTEPPPDLTDFTIAADKREPCDVAALNALRNLKDDFEEAKEKFSSDEWRKRIAVLKALGIAADVAASAVAAEGQMKSNYSLTTFINEALQVGLTDSDCQQLIDNWASRHCEGNLQVRPFQRAVADSPSFVTLARAGCGSGKSLAAYLWAKAWCAKTTAGEKTTVEGRSFRLFFCLPTTGTTTEHFKDYALESGIPASLTHSRSEVDLKSLAQTADQESNFNVRDAAIGALIDARDKIESLALWDTPLVVSTADTVLGLMGNARRSLYAFPAIVSSAIVFDEIHAFDDRLFGHLLMFLKYFPRQPVLLMTASLPQHRLDALQSIRNDLHIVDGPPELERLERYQLDHGEDEQKVWDAIKACVQSNGKVLWVRNRVDWANQAYEACLERFPEVMVNVYHSRFRYKDRSRLHRHVIDHFKQKPKQAQILIATQVAEMSLDLSADLLVTDIAPIPSLIQRLGRLNREPWPSAPKSALVCPLPAAMGQGDDPALPYVADDLSAAEMWLTKLIEKGTPLSQFDLADAFGCLSHTEAFDICMAEEKACFFSGLWETRPGKTREDGYTISVILEVDLNQCHQRNRHGEPTRDWLTEHEVAIPFKSEVLKWGVVGNRRVAPSQCITYDFDPTTMKGVGARWASGQPITNCQIL
ncbi:MAG: CRISPR-associated helicase Cas3' [Chloracidobacterium sp.]